MFAVFDKQGNNILAAKSRHTVQRSAIFLLFRNPSTEIENEEKENLNANEYFSNTSSKVSIFALWLISKDTISSHPLRDAMRNAVHLVCCVWGHSVANMLSFFLNLKYVVSLTSSAALTFALRESKRDITSVCSSRAAASNGVL